MGCDIHAFTEVRNPETNTWRPAKPEKFDLYDDGRMRIEQSPWIRRNYLLFGLLADEVRISFDFSFPQQGLPDDISEEVDEVHTDWKDDAHSHSYLTRAELETKLIELLITPKSEGVDYCTQALSALLKQLPEPPEDHNDQRLVFWFDN